MLTVLAETSKLLDAAEKAFFLVVGGLIAICVQRISARLNEKRGRVHYFRLVFRGFPDAHKCVLFPGLTSEIWESKVPAGLRDHCMTVAFFMESVGRAVIKDLRVTVDAKNGSGIAAYQFAVAKSVICDRLETKEVEDQRVIANWKYINPGEEIELYVLIAGIDDPRNVEIGVDAEGIEVKERKMLQKSIQAMMSSQQMPLTADDSV
jgi:hypothetical protein